MNVLLVSPKLPYTFWTLHETARMGRRKATTTPLGLITIAALLPDRWRLRLIDRNTADIPPDLWDWCDMVMLSCMLVQKEDTLALVREAKRRGKIVAVGGPYATVHPDELLEADADFVFRGEAEDLIPAFVSALEEGKRGVVFEEQEKPDIDSSPVPRFDLLNMSAYTCMSVQTTRGCPHDCEFCDVVRLNGRKPRHKSVDRVMEEMETLHSLGWINDVFIADDNLIGDRAYALELLPRLARWNKKRGEPFNFWAQVTVTLGQDEELIDLLTDANFSYVFVGVESPDTEALKAAGKRQNLRTSLDTSVQSINRNGLSMIASFIIGLDGETTGLGDRICEFVERNGIPIPMLNILYVSPHTRLWRRFEREGRLKAPVSWAFPIDGRLNYIPSRPESEVKSEYARAVDRLYEPGAYLRRAYRYYLNMRPTRKALGMPGPCESPDDGDVRPVRRATLSANLWYLSHLVYRRGIRGSHRALFWEQLYGMWKQNPSRLIGYLIALGFGENLFQLRRVVAQRQDCPESTV